MFDAIRSWYGRWWFIRVERSAARLARKLYSLQNNKTAVESTLRRAKSGDLALIIAEWEPCAGIPKDKWSQIQNEVSREFNRRAALEKK